MASHVRRRRRRRFLEDEEVYSSGAEMERDEINLIGHLPSLTHLEILFPLGEHTSSAYEDEPLG